MSASLAARTEGYAEAAHLVNGEAVPDGLHWRVVPPAQPAGPVVVRDFPVRERAEARVRAHRGEAAPWRVRPGEDLVLTVDGEPGWLTGWLEVEGDGDLRVAVIAEQAAQNGEDIELAARADRPWLVASSGLTRARVSGDGVVERVTAWRCVSRAEYATAVLDVASLDLDLVGELAGAYAFAHAGVEPAEERVRRAAPGEPLPYAPRQPWPGYSPDDELRRVLSLVERGGPGGAVRGWLRTAAEALLAGRAAGNAVAATGGGQALRFPVTAALAVAATDPGVARWLARQGLYEGRGEYWQEGQPAMAVALVPVVVLRRPRLMSRAPEVERLYDDALGGGLAELRERVAAIPVRGLGRPPDDRRWMVDLLQLPMPFYPKATPAVPRTAALGLSGPPVWTAPAEGDAGVDGWEQSVALGAVAPFGPVSFVRTDAGARATMHALSPDGEVASPLLAGWPQPAELGTVPVGDATVRGRTTIASAADAVPVRWELRLGDWTGRWGAASEIDVAPPPPAPPAPPVLRATFVRTAVPDEGPASPGLIHVELEVAASPALGALPLAALHVGIDGVEAVLGLPAGARLTHDHPAPATRPGETRTVRVEAWAVDVSGTRSSAAVAEVRAADGRPVPVPTVSPRLLVAGRPGPAPEVGLPVRVRAVPHAAFYRFYTAAEAVVRAKTGLSATGFRTRPRAERAAELLARGLPPREGFVLSETAEVVAGVAEARLAIPSGTSDLVLVRAVPVTGGVDAYGKRAEGVEAPVGIVPVCFTVVPGDEVPPLPRVTVRVVAEGRIAVTVEVSGVPAGVLSQLPGALEARIVEVVGDDPFYWPEVAIRPLARAATAHTATVELEVPTWARLRLAAAVRYAAEPTTVPGADVVVDPEVAAAGPQPERAILSPWGPVSAPAAVDVPGAEPTVSAVPDDGALQVTVSGLPLASSGSSSFTAAVYRSDPVTDALTETGERHPVTGEAPSFTIAFSPAAVVLEDPFGRPRPAVHLG